MRIEERTTRSKKQKAYIVLMQPGVAPVQPRRHVEAHVRLDDADHVAGDCVSVGINAFEHVGPRRSLEILQVLRVARPSRVVAPGQLLGGVLKRGPRWADKRVALLHKVFRKAASAPIRLRRHPRQARAHFHVFRFLLVHAQAGILVVDRSPIVVARVYKVAVHDAVLVGAVASPRGIDVTGELPIANARIGAVQSFVAVARRLERTAARLAARDRARGCAVLRFAVDDAAIPVLAVHVVNSRVAERSLALAAVAEPLGDLGTLVAGALRFLGDRLPVGEPRRDEGALSCEHGHTNHMSYPL